MPRFAYTAINRSGAAIESVMDAPSEARAREQLAGLGERVVRLTEIASESGSIPTKRSGKRPGVEEVATTIRQMSILIRAGVPLVEGLQGLAEQARSPVLRDVLAEITKDVSHGGALSDAFAKHPEMFPTLAVEMARVAEAGGDLAGAMGKLAEHMEFGAEITRKVKSALAYPVVVMAISVITVLLMVTFILPRFMKLFSQMDAKLPWTTQALMATSHFVTGRWYVLLIVAGALAYAARKYARSESGKRRIDGLLLRLPIVGDIVSKITLSRALATMATLLASGIPMVKTLETSAAAANNEIVKEALLKARSDIAQGAATSQSLKACALFPPLVLQMVASGEKTGELPMMLDYVCGLYARETDAKVKSLTSVIEPVMIAVLGVIVGFIAMSVIVPIYSLVGGVK